MYSPLLLLRVTKKIHGKDANVDILQAIPFQSEPLYTIKPTHADFIQLPMHVSYSLQQMRAKLLKV